MNTPQLQEPQIEAKICELGGAYFPVRIQAIPRVGELIDLFSFLDSSTGHEPRKFYEVVQVLHSIHDLGPNAANEGGPKGAHAVAIFVKPSTSSLFSGV